MALQVTLQAPARELVSLFPLPDRVADQALHGQSFSVIRMLLENLICCLDALLELLGLIELDERSEEGCILARKSLGVWLAGHRASGSLLRP